MSDKIVTLDSTNFKEIALNSDKPVLVDFWATWCAPCRMMAKPIDEVAAETEGKVVVAKLDVDDAGDIAHEYGIQGIPTLILFKDGKIVDRQTGLKTKTQIMQMIADK